MKREQDRVQEIKDFLENNQSKMSLEKIDRIYAIFHMCITYRKKIVKKCLYPSTEGKNVFSSFKMLSTTHPTYTIPA